jgi:hypothetical protein
VVHHVTAFSSGESPRVPGYTVVSVLSFSSLLEPNVEADSQLLVVLSITALLAPAKLILKALLGAMGLFYWHITPVILSLPLEDRLR